MSHRRLLTCLLTALAGCAGRAGPADAWPDRSAWSYAPGASAAPQAHFGEPNTGGGLSLECLPSAGVLQLVISDTEITGDRVVEVRVGAARYATTERLDPPDGFAVSCITIPLAAPVLTQFAADAGPMTIHSGAEVWSLPHALEPVRMVRDCIALNAHR